MRSGTPYLVRVCAYLQGGSDLQGGADLKRGLALTKFTITTNPCTSSHSPLATPPNSLFSEKLHRSSDIIHLNEPKPFWWPWNYLHPMVAWVPGYTSYPVNQLTDSQWWEWSINSECVTGFWILIQITPFVPSWLFPHLDIELAKETANQVFMHQMSKRFVLTQWTHDVMITS